MVRIVWLLLTFAIASCVNASKILVIFPMPARSHGILGDGIVRHLLNAGHEVTYITPFPKDKVHPKLRQVDVSENFEHFPVDNLNIKTIMDSIIPMDLSMALLTMTTFSSKTLENENVVRLLEDGSQHFHLVIAEWMYSDLYAGIPAIYNAPLVWFSSTEPHSMILSLVDETLNPSYNTFIVAAVPPLSLFQRISELFFTFKVTVIRETIIEYSQNSIYQRLIAPYIEKRGRVAPSFEELKNNASLVLGNSHVSLGEATRLPQIYKPIGGYHVDENFKPLPENLQKLMDEAKHGVVYFSLGSNLKSKHLPDEIKQGLVKVFGSLKQTVLWKFEEVMLDLPKNVHILKWAPQQSILSHPNCILFITHGGQLSTTESVHTGVPIIAIPAYGDQFTNAMRAVAKGFAMHVPLSYTMVEELKKAIQDMLTDPKYRQKAKELSFIYHDRPASPGTELVFWVEHVIRTSGAPHLRSAALMLPWYQKIYLDLVVLLLILGYTFIKLCKNIKSLIYKKKDDKKKRN